MAGALWRCVFGKENDSWQIITPWQIITTHDMFVFGPSNPQLVLFWSWLLPEAMPPGQHDIATAQNHIDEEMPKLEDSARDPDKVWLKLHNRTTCTIARHYDPGQYIPKVIPHYTLNLKVRLACPSQGSNGPVSRSRMTRATAGPYTGISSESARQTSHNLNKAP